MPSPKTLAEVIEELRNDPASTDAPAQDNILEYVQNKERGTASAEAQTVQEVTNLMVQNPQFRNDLTKMLPEAEQSKYKGERFEKLVTDSTRSVLKKMIYDLFGTKKAAAKAELEQLAKGAFSHIANNINDSAMGPVELRRRNPDYPGECESINHTYETEAGNKVELKGAKYVPPQPTGKVVLVFTGSNLSAATQIDTIKDAYLDAGATVISMDYRGFGQSREYDKGGKEIIAPPSEQTLNQDGRAMYDYVLKSIPGIKPSDIILHGYSMGGPVAANLAANIAEENTKKGEVVKEDDRLGGLVLHSPVATSYEAALNVRHEEKAASLMGWIFGGGHSTRSHMRRLHSNDPALPVHYIGGSSADLLSLESTKINKDPRAQFANASTYTGKDHHMGKNVSSDDPGLRAMVQHGRRAQLAPQRTNTQPSVERAPGKQP